MRTKLPQALVPIFKINMSEVNGHNPVNPELRPVTNEKGEQLSPLLPEEVKNYLIDIDGTICDDIPNEEPERMVDCPFYPDALEVINRWYDDGHIITFFYFRTEAHRQITETCWTSVGFKYHGLLVRQTRGGNYH
jgi:hypothetical protein